MQCISVLLDTIKVADKKILMTAELKGCVTCYILFWVFFK